MKRWQTIAAVICSCAAWLGLRAAASPPVAPTEALAPEEERARFKLPPGFAIQLVASEPEIQKPMNLAFDTRGRLWVTHSVEYPFAAADDATPRDGLTVLEDFGPDGRARKATRFADGLNIPIGVLPLPKAAADGRGQEVIVWSIPIYGSSPTPMATARPTAARCSTVPSTSPTPTATKTPSGSGPTAASTWPTFTTASSATTRST